MSSNRILPILFSTGFITIGKAMITTGSIRTPIRKKNITTERPYNATYPIIIAIAIKIYLT